MLRNKSFRMKMLAVTMAPLLVLTVFAALLVLPRVNAAQAASDNQRAAQFSQLAANMVAGLQEERDYSAWWLVNQNKVLKRDLDSARVDSDRRQKELLGNGSNVPAALKVASAQAIKAVSDLKAVRTSVDAGNLSPAQASAAYSKRISSLLQFGRALAAESSTVETSRDATALSDLIEARNQLSLLRGDVVAKLEAGELVASDLPSLMSIEEGMKTGLGRYGLSVTPTEAKRLSDAVTAPRVAVSGKTLDSILGGLLANTPTIVSAQKWWDDQGPMLNELNRFTGQRYTAYQTKSSTLEKDARGQVLFFSLAALGAILFAGLVALGFARTITRRLSSLTQQAHVIATERLPEVLNALRNPTAEAVAGALPTVQSDSDDELGQMADSFNKVLHTSVKTSLEHSQQRSQTVTNMLVNLGRRNQSLIDRQLKIMDRLEAKEEDPDTLEALYEVDHLVTRMRRNAENLLVLSGQKQARTWAKPVTLFDVLRSAASEVSDLNRAVIGDVSGELIMSGPFAVDVSHLLAELVENATRYSPKTTSVYLDVSENDESVIVRIVDSGVGMSADERSTANERLAHPPEIDELATDRVGFQVVGRLGRKLNALVLIEANENGGIAAVVSLPRALFEHQNKETRPTSFSASMPSASMREASPLPTAVPPAATSKRLGSGNAIPDPVTDRGQATVGSQKVGLRSADAQGATRSLDDKLPKAPVTATSKRAAEPLLPQRGGKTGSPVSSVGHLAPPPLAPPYEVTHRLATPPAAVSVPPVVSVPVVSVPTVVESVLVTEAEVTPAVMQEVPVVRLTPAEAVLLDVERLLGTPQAQPATQSAKPSVAPLESSVPSGSRLVPEPVSLIAPARPEVAVPVVNPAVVVNPAPPVSTASDLPSRTNRVASEVQREGFGRLPEAPVTTPTTRSASTFSAFQSAKQKVSEALIAANQASDPLPTSGQATDPTSGHATDPTSGQATDLTSGQVTDFHSDSHVASAVDRVLDEHEALQKSAVALAVDPWELSEVVAPQLTEHGLIQRRPGTVMSATAQAADAGAFKRLGTGTEADAIEVVPASSRFAALSRLQRGVNNARPQPADNQTDLSANTTNGDLP